MGDEPLNRIGVTTEVGIAWVYTRPFCLYLQVTSDVHFQKDLRLDSLDTVETVIALEEEFKLEIPVKEVDKIDSCFLAIEYIHNHPMAKSQNQLISFHLVIA
ncbi:hypothetical protein HYC85_010668 [Camellia sinensis]|uniref:Acyl carrier protein n=1 Tax=Camellia sinensis TaxID=4442 RepID=A0A7J7HL51_CAMSI|nr:hypothetical protein HYC85_010668 [Camellia sinensis]